jgi:hypothetical protein
MEPQSHLRKFRDWVDRTDIAWLTLLPMLAAFGLLFIAAYISNKIFPDGLPDMLRGTVFIFVSLISGLPGLAKIYKRKRWGHAGRIQGGLSYFLDGIA